MIINVNVDVLDELSNNEKQELSDDLYALGVVPKQIGVASTVNVNAEFDK